MGILDEMGDMFRRTPRGPLWQRPPELPPVQQPPAELDPMQFRPGQRDLAIYEFIKKMQREQPYGRGYSETQAPPRGETDPYSLKTMNRMIGGTSTADIEDEASARYAATQPDAGRELPREYQTSPQDEARMAQLLQNLRPQFPAAPPLPPRRPPGY